MLHATRIAVWARKIESLGHRAVLLPPAPVRPSVLRNKTDRPDTRGLLEAHRNEDLHSVPIKTVEPQAARPARDDRSPAIQAFGAAGAGHDQRESRRRDAERHVRVGETAGGIEGPKP